MSPCNDRCDHPNCYGLPCKQLTDEELAPAPEDRALAEQLIAEGWTQVSAKYRILRRWAVPVPTPEELIRPEMIGTYFGKQLVRSAKMLGDETALRCAPCGHRLYEERTLTVREFKAYKDLQRAAWRKEVARVVGRTS